jgi:hypothetical protein
MLMERLFALSIELCLRVVRRSGLDGRAGQIDGYR